MKFYIGVSTPNIVGKISFWLMCPI